MLTANPWKIAYSTTDTLSAVKLEVASWNTLGSVYVTYNSNGTYLYSDSSSYGSWELTNDKTITYNKGKEDASTATIQSISPANLTISYMYDVLGDSTLHNVTETCIKK